MKTQAISLIILAFTSGAFARAPNNAEKGFLKQYQDAVYEPHKHNLPYLHDKALGMLEQMGHDGHSAPYTAPGEKAQWMDFLNNVKEVDAKAQSKIHRRGQDIDLLSGDDQGRSTVPKNSNVGANEDLLGGFGSEEVQPVSAKKTPPRIRQKLVKTKLTDIREDPLEHLGDDADRLNVANDEIDMNKPAMKDPKTGKWKNVEKITAPMQGAGEPEAFDMNKSAMRDPVTGQWKNVDKPLKMNQIALNEHVDLSKPVIKDKNGQLRNIEKVTAPMQGAGEQIDMNKPVIKGSNGQFRNIEKMTAPMQGSGEHLDLSKPAIKGSNGQWKNIEKPTGLHPIAQEHFDLSKPVIKASNGQFRNIEKVTGLHPVEMKPSTGSSRFFEGMRLRPGEFIPK